MEFLHLFKIKERKRGRDTRQSSKYFTKKIEMKTKFIGIVGLLFFASEYIWFDIGDFLNEKIVSCGFIKERITKQ